MQKTDLIKKIVEIAGDYRKGEITPFNGKHVERWVNQFEVNESHKIVILGEVAHMLGNYYISRANAKDLISRMFKTMPKESVGGVKISDITFLVTQEEGKSQYAILQLAEELLQENYSTSIKDCGGSKVYLYLDDCVYSGNKYRYDITDSPQLESPIKGSVLVSCHCGIYVNGFSYAKDRLQHHLAKKGVQLKPFREKLLNDNCNSREPLDIMWPKYIKGSKKIDAAISNINGRCAQRGWSSSVGFRSNQIVSSNIFTSPANQMIVEQAFLEVGSKLYCAAQSPAFSMRPMGFKVLTSIGFGTPVVTWRNIPNNAPLALWYGDPSSYSSNHPLGMWYPLFPRKI